MPCPARVMLLSPILPNATSCELLCPPLPEEKPSKANVYSELWARTSDSRHAPSQESRKSERSSSEGGKERTRTNVSHMQAKDVQEGYDECVEEIQSTGKNSLDAVRFCNGGK